MNVVVHTTFYLKPSERVLKHDAELRFLHALNMSTLRRYLKNILNDSCYVSRLQAASNSSLVSLRVDATGLIFLFRYEA